MIHWKTIEGWPYEVSNLGKVRRIGGKELRPCGEPYERVTLANGPKRTLASIHVLVLRAFSGPRPSVKHQAAHWDGNRKNNNADNLRWALPIENSEDKRRHGRVTKGTDVHGSVLTPQDIAAILASPYSSAIEGKRYGVSHSTIARVRKGLTWAHLDRQAQPKRRQSGCYTAAERAALGLDDVMRALRPLPESA